MPDFGALSDLFGAIGDALSSIKGFTGSADDINGEGGLDKVTEAFGSLTGDK